VQRIRRALVIRNPAAGSRDTRAFRRLVEGLRATGIAATVRETAAAGDAEEMARDGRGGAWDVVVAAGGDGTVNEVVNGLGEEGPPLAVFPAGTANVLAAEMGLPCDAAAFAAAISAWTPRPAWLAEINGRRFVTMASIGFDAEVVAGVGSLSKGMLGKGAYVLSACRRLLLRRPGRFALTIDGAPFEAAGAVMAKSHFYGGRFVAAPEARITAPMLHVVLLADGRRRDILRQMAALACGRLHLLPGVTIVAGREVTIAGAAAPVQVDGDIRATVPLTLRVCARPIMVYQAA
jgi:YegS/Rv2252/BmrU family lipid kinase